MHKIENLSLLSFATRKEGSMVVNQMVEVKPTTRRLLRRVQRIELGLGLIRGNCRGAFRQETVEFNISIRNLQQLGVTIPEAIA